MKYSESKSDTSRFLDAPIPKRRANSTRARSNRKSRRGARNSATPARNGPTQWYQAETLRPIVCLAFVIPLLLFYEIGAVVAPQGTGRSGLDEWFNWLLINLGFGHVVILPLLTVGILLAWHHRVDDRWSIKPRVLLGMVAESTCLGLILFWAATAIFQVFEHQDLATTQAVNQVLSMTGQLFSPTWWAGTVTYIGSGVYEELVFRLILLSALIKIGNKYFESQHVVQVGGILATSIVFAAIHYNIFNSAAASDFDLQSFAFRLIASMVFCVLFIFRGFGVAAGTHAAYDLLTQL